MNQQERQRVKLELIKVHEEMQQLWTAMILMQQNQGSVQSSHLLQIGVLQERIAKLIDSL